MGDSIDISNGAARRAAAVAAHGAMAPPSAVILDRVVEEIKEGFKIFLDSFKYDVGEGDPSSVDESEPYYAGVARRMTAADSNTLEVNMVHVSRYSPELADAIMANFLHVQPGLDAATQLFMMEREPTHPTNKLSQSGVEARGTQFRAAWRNVPTVLSIRELKTAAVGQLVAIAGTVTRTSAVRPELMSGTFRCADCKTLHANVPQQFKFTDPTHCLQNNCTNRTRWALDTSLSLFLDWQVVRVQELSSSIPAGSLPRTLPVVLRSHDLVESVKPGDKAVFTGCLIVVPDVAQLGRSGPKLKSAVRGGRGGAETAAAGGVAGLKELGVRDLTYSLAFLASSVRACHSSFGSTRGEVDLAQGVAEQDDASHEMDEQGNPLEDVEAMFTPSQRQRVLEMKQHGRLYTRLTSSIAPTIFGHDEIKRGILLQLLGGVHKRTADGQNLRGDINVCIVGDPSTSKSQFLKYVCSFLPRAVYTSGKASSAAGLTASVARDPETGDFAIEAGALMLADHGLAAIDEFDKMDPADQVAIHEAMEQQTISIAKAGIQATLNARTAILAAANPVKGRYDTSRTLKQNVDISAPIMSRFDLFFVVLDEGDQAIDYNVARHIVQVHSGRAQVLQTEFSAEDLQLYIRYARTRRPRIGDEARKFLVENYVALRGADATGSNRSAYRITVRQLESLIRLSEARARLDLAEEVTPAHVKEAARLLKKSIVHVESQDVGLEDVDDEAEWAGELGGSGGGDDGDGDDDMGGQGPPRNGHPRTPKAAKKSPARRGEAKDAEMETGAEGEGAGEGRAEGEQEQEKRPEVKVSFAEYQRITLLLVSHMRAAERAAVSRGEEPGSAAMSWKELVNFYVAALVSGAEGAPSSEQELAAATRLVELVLHRLIKTDHVLLLLRKSKDKSKRLLQVHPNFTGERDDLRPAPAAEEGQPEPEPALDEPGTADEGIRADLLALKAAQVEPADGSGSGSQQEDPFAFSEQEEHKMQDMPPATPTSQGRKSRTATPTSGASRASGRTPRSGRK